ncbi:MAG: hypothetical protein K5650_07720 [Bacteroidales bacterium]|nr:hypothetical protein [Bacteroidales bacterium]
MKTCKNKSLKACVVALLLLSAVSVNAQPEIYSVGSGILQGYSLIRHYYNDDLIIYRQPNFYYICSTCTTAVVHVCINPDIEIHDMEIYGDYLYFCGVDLRPSPTEAVFGYVSLADLASSSPADFYYEYIPYFTAEDVLVTDAFKLEVFDNGNDIHMVMIGDCERDDYLRYPRCVIDAYTAYPLVTGGTWDIEMRYEPLNIEYYSDIVVTDNYVSTVAYKHEAEGQYLRFYDRPLNSGETIFNTPLFEDIYYCFHYDITDEPFIATKLTDDEIVTATIALNNDYKPGILLSRFDCSGQTLVNQQFITVPCEYNSKFKIIEMAYEFDFGTLSILTNINVDDSGIFSHILDVPHYMTGALPYPVFFYRTNNNDPLFSLTSYTPNSQLVVTVGGNVDTLIYYIHQPGIASPVSCETEIEINNMEIEDNLDFFPKLLPMERNVATPIRRSGSDMSYIINNICK